MKIADQSLQWTKHVPIIGGHGASLYDIGGVFSHNIRDLKLFERAAAVSFNFLMAIPAFLIFLFSMVPYLPLESVQNTILNTIHLLSPNPKMDETLQGILVDFMDTKRKDLMSIGILTTIFVASNAVMGIIRGFDRKTTLLKERSGLKRRVHAIWLTLVIMLVVLISIGLLIFQSNITRDYVLRILPNPGLIQIGSWSILVIIVYFMVCLLYKFGPSLTNKLSFFSPGASLATSFLFLISWGFFFAANNFIHYNKVYGPIGTLLMFMVWMFIIGLVILTGYEINLAILSLDKQRKEKKFREGDTQKFQG